MLKSKRSNQYDSWNWKTKQKILIVKILYYKGKSTS